MTRLEKRIFNFIASVRNIMVDVDAFAEKVSYYISMYVPEGAKSFDDFVLTTDTERDGADESYSTERMLWSYGIDPESENMEPIYAKERADDPDFMSIIKDLADQIREAHPEFIDVEEATAIEETESEVTQMKKNYKEYPKFRMGESDIACLIAVGCGDEAVKTRPLYFGSDGYYTAYMVDNNAEIGDHYWLVDTFNSWLKIYDDFGIVYSSPVIHDKDFKIYRAGDFGCIIQFPVEDISEIYNKLEYDEDETCSEISHILEKIKDSEGDFIITKEDPDNPDEIGILKAVGYRNHIEEDDDFEMD